MIAKHSRTQELKENQQSRAEVRIAAFLHSCVLECSSSFILIAQKIADAKQRAEDERRKGTITTDRIRDPPNDTLRSAGLEQITTTRLKEWLEE